MCAPSPFSLPAYGTFLNFMIFFQDIRHPPLQENTEPGSVKFDNADSKVNKESGKMTMICLTFFCIMNFVHF